MTARCASCSYPLTISDSVACYECRSYFHIDCAQLVGFPYYELSSDPNRNTFHCRTCELLPLPRRDLDSDSDEEEMPSRQLDYHLEADSDQGKEMSEVRGSIQDLSDLCKDMLREINELKSINLTLRCCVENLRHESDERDKVVTDLRRRLEALEHKSGGVKLKLEGDEESIRVERVYEAEQYLIIESETLKLGELKDIVAENCNYKHNTSTKEIKGLQNQDLQSEENAKSKPEEERTDLKISTANVESNLDPISVEDEQAFTKENKSDLDVEQKIVRKSSTENESKVSIAAEESIKDWDWKGNKAVELDETGVKSESEEEDEEEIEKSEVDDSDAQGWEALDEEIKSVTNTQLEVEDTHASADKSLWDSKKNDKTEDADEEEETLVEQERSWADSSERYKPQNENENLDQEEEEPWDYESQTETELQPARVYEDSTKDATEDEKPSDHEDHEEGSAEKTSDEVREGEGASPGDSEGEKLPEGVEGDVTAEEAAIVDGEARLEASCEGEPGIEGEHRLGGQSPVVEGEVQPAESSEPAEPPPPPVPQHTEEDLWQYLKETVTSVHPSTVEEFVQNLIGTLQHVPEEYLLPVIDANIKRATSPTITDGEHLPTPEGIPLVEGEAVAVDGSAPEEGVQTADVDEAVVTGEEEAAANTTEVPPEEFPEVPTVPEDSTETPEGYSAVEGALFGGFWVCWLLYTYWGT